MPASIAAEQVSDLVYLCAVIPAENETVQNSAARDAVADRTVSADEWVSQTFQEQWHTRSTGQDNAVLTARLPSRRHIRGMVS